MKVWSVQCWFKGDDFVCVKKRKSGTRSSLHVIFHEGLFVSGPSCRWLCRWTGIWWTLMTLWSWSVCSGPSHKSRVWTCLLCPTPRRWSSIAMSKTGRGMIKALQSIRLSCEWSNHIWKTICPPCVKPEVLHCLAVLLECSQQDPIQPDWEQLPQLQDLQAFLS